MPAEKTKIKSFRLKVSTLEQLSKICLKSDRKVNWYVQKILDAYLQKVKK
jgi:predicted DNA-binding protein